jgi:hypothetical protein
MRQHMTPATSVDQPTFADWRLVSSHVRDRCWTVKP